MGPIRAYIRHEGRGKGVHLIQRCSPIDARESRSGRDVAQVVVLRLDASIVPEIEEQVAAGIHVVVQTPQFVVEGIGAGVLVQIVVEPVRQACSIRRGIKLQVRLRNWIQQTRGNLVAGCSSSLRPEAGTRRKVWRQGISRSVALEWLTGDRTSAEDTGVRIVELTGSHERREVALPFGGRGNRCDVRGWLGVIEILPGEEPKKLVLPVVQLREYHRATRSQAVLVEMGNRFRRAF